MIEVDDVSKEVKIDLEKPTGERRVTRLPTFYICGLKLKYVDVHTIKSTDFKL